MNRLLKNNKGFTLIEIVITIAIFSIIIVPLYSLFITAAKANNISANKLNATIIAQSYMEELKAIDTIEYEDKIYTYDMFIDDQKSGDGLLIKNVKFDGNTYEVYLHVEETEYKFDDADEGNSNNCRLYKINIKVKEKDKGDVLQEINGYKSFIK
ncbi:type IV pilus modification PilV family protein [Caldisalinibacter kiritimatiensis]|uniref:Prepilin-type N-terminal cleavage/methylation domain-containing protein n=1 Tax=Caldisalinibacter kiritimatiensis TaxID=1304284 RepID=R1CS96_9FIRM|nr:prepilin-type N-terminal cleavage/methylation domain-containing protein [Caldisalinibacter kiritimatiensis]EOD01521.1 hypothetical protein L21TH_0404 [Caldisalinibacter kiritimatiensis]